MSLKSTIFESGFGFRVYFESYGVLVGVESNTAELLAEAISISQRALAGEVRIIESPRREPSFFFGVAVNEDRYFLYKDGRQDSHNDSKRLLFKSYNSMLRNEIAQLAVSKIFIHAGVVARNGRAIVIPAYSFKGKTTLVAELIKNGAVYYSDEYAVVDNRGLIHPYPRHLSVRYEDRDEEVPAESLGATIGTEPIPAGMILFTEYAPQAVWNPEMLGKGRGIMGLIPYTIPFIVKVEESLRVLKTMTDCAIIVSSTRGDAKSFSKTILSFFDKNAVSSVKSAIL